MNGEWISQTRARELYKLTASDLQENVSHVIDQSGTNEGDLDQNSQNTSASIKCAQHPSVPLTVLLVRNPRGYRTPMRLYKTSELEMLSQLKRSKAEPPKSIDKRTRKKRSKREKTVATPPSAGSECIRRGHTFTNTLGNMQKCSRVVLRRRCRYNTRSNKQRKVKTPGGRLVVQRRVKVAQGPKCGDCKCKLAGIPAIRPHLYRNLKKRERTVARAYGGVRCHNCVKDRIIRAFLKEEQRSLKKVIEERDAKKNAAVKGADDKKDSAAKKAVKATKSEGARESRDGKPKQKKAAPKA
ncbi:60S ribosomal protein L34 [Babesia ovis]|uniref:60S ribosomal protein L34 n=1 Tax=Babesia ovis TaxID=5869 RepID=A0A9W5WW11_BABOV|nr:60S ribosomal protein L34 [Babesia ovis]